MHFFPRGPNFLYQIWEESCMYVVDPQGCNIFKLGFLHIHNSLGVEEQT